MTTIVRTIRVEIAKPMAPMSWDELGMLFRVQRRIVPQLLRAGMDARIAIGVVGAEATKGSLDNVAKGASPQSIVYQAMARELARIKDGKWGDDARKALDIPGSMLSALSQRVMQTYKMRPAFRGTQPIPVRRQETKISVDGSGAIVLTVKLLSAGTVKLVLVASHGSHWATLKSLASGNLDYGDCKIVFNEDRRKWYALLSYESESLARPKSVKKSEALIVHRGIVNALSMLSTSGWYGTEPGKQLQHQLQSIASRQNNARSISAYTLGSGARGHGKRRRYEHYEALSGKRDRIASTFCQQMGAMVVRRALENGCGTVVIEDYGGLEPHKDPDIRRVLERFPLYRLKQAIANACEKHSLELVQCPSHYVSTTCPACGASNERFHNHRTNTFHCDACSFERPADFVALLNQLAYSGFKSKVWRQRMDEYKRLVRRLKESVA